MRRLTVLMLKAHSIKVMLLLLTGVLCLSLNVSSQQVAKTISTPSGQIGFLEFRPAGYGSQKHPLIVFMHGWGERGNGTTQINSVTANGIPHLIALGASMQFTVGGVTSSFVVLSPQLSTVYGTWPSFYVKEMIKYAKANLEIDTNRIYVTGLSLGGGGSWIYAFENMQNDLGIAALAPVCGTDDGDDGNACNSAVAAHLPIWTFHCADDGTVPLGSMQHVVDWVIGVCNPHISPTVRVTVYQSGGHGGAWNNAYDMGHLNVPLQYGTSQVPQNLYEWFLSNKRVPPVANAGGTQTVILPATSTTLNGSASYSPVTTLNGYSWQEISGPNTASITNATAATPTIDNLTNGLYKFQLTVTDAVGLSSAAQVSVLVTPGILPVDISYFTGKRNGGVNTLDWATASEQNTDYFAIERSEDGKIYTAIDKVAGAGNSTAIKEYSFRDLAAPNGNAFYRLREVDKDGQYKLSKVLLINGGNRKTFEQLYPNPVHENLLVTLNNEVKGNGRIALYDISGRVMLQENIAKTQELYNYTVDTRKLVPGLYFVEVKVGENYKVMQRIVKE